MSSIVDSSGNQLTTASVDDRVTSIEQALPDIINAIVNLQKAVVKLNTMLNMLVAPPEMGSDAAPADSKGE